MMRTLNWMRRLLPRLASFRKQGAWNPTRRALILAAGLASLLAGGVAQADDLAYGHGGGSKWAATWATSIQSAYAAPTTPQGAAVPGFDPQPDLSFALPNATVNGASNQTFRMIVKPDLWGHTIRVRFSNVFGTRPVTFSHAAVALGSAKLRSGCGSKPGTAAPCGVVGA
ncbi:MAG: hypothetical protein EOO78_18625, partial [Oxalobacteraceae bacterium]